MAGSRKTNCNITAMGVILYSMVRKGGVRAVESNDMPTIKIICLRS